jgi:hypothetical protein
MSSRPEKHTLFTRSRFFLYAIVLVGGCSLAPTETEQSRALTSPLLESTLPQESTLVENVAECELEVDCCGNLNCKPAPCPIFCL